MGSDLITTIVTAACCAWRRPRWLIVNQTNACNMIAARNAHKYLTIAFTCPRRRRHRRRCSRAGHICRCIQILPRKRCIFLFCIFAGLLLTAQHLLWATPMCVTQRPNGQYMRTAATPSAVPIPAGASARRVFPSALRRIFAWRARKTHFVATPVTVAVATNAQNSTHIRTHPCPPHPPGETPKNPATSWPMNFSRTCEQTHICADSHAKIGSMCVRTTKVTV